VSGEVGEPVVLRLRRTGGLAGIPAAVTVELSELAHGDADLWRATLGGEGARGLVPAAPGRTVPDAYAYHLAAPPDGDEVTVAEHDLPPEVRDLFERTLAAARQTPKSGAEGPGDVPGVR
jgi:hypothetical protein